MDSPPNYLNEIHDFLDFSQLDPHLGDDSYLISRASSSYVVEDSSEFEKGNTAGSGNLIATHSPLYQTAFNCSGKSSSFSPWAAPIDSGFIMTASKREGQLLLKKCLLQMLPWTRDVRSSKHFVQAEVDPDSQTVNYSNLNTSSTSTTSGQQDETAKQHMLAERTRRRKQKECVQILQTLLPKKPKMDKASVLQSAIEHLKELQACKEDLEKRMEELESTNAALKSLCESGSISNRYLFRGEGSDMSVNTNIHGSTNINSIGGMVLPSPDSTMSSLHTHDYCGHDIPHGTSISTKASVSINSSRQSDNTLSINVLITAQLTSGSDQLVRVLICLKDLGLQLLSIKSRFEGGIFMAEISAIANKDVIWGESQIEDAFVNTLLNTYSSN